MSEYTLWDGALAHFGVRVQPSGVRSFVLQIRVDGRMRKFTLGRFPETSLADARKQEAALLSRSLTWSSMSAPGLVPGFPIDNAGECASRHAVSVYCRCMWRLLSCSFRLASNR